MSSTHTKPYGDSDPNGDLDYIPRKIFDDTEEITEAVGRHPSAFKPKRPLTGRVALQAADKRAQREQYASELGTNADLRGTSREELDRQVKAAHEVHNEVFVHTPIATQLQVDFSPEEPDASSSDSSKDMVHAADPARAAIRQARLRKVTQIRPPRHIENNLGSPPEPVA